MVSTFDFGGNISSHLSCTRSIIHDKILISPGCPRSSIALQVQWPKKIHSFIHFVACYDGVSGDDDGDDDDDDGGGGGDNVDDGDDDDDDDDDHDDDDDLTVINGYPCLISRDSIV